MVLPDEMRRLWAEHGMDARIAACIPNEQPLKEQTIQHRAYCCTITVITYSEPVTNTEVAILHRQVRVGSSAEPAIYIMRFCVGAVVYVQRLL